MGLSAKLTGARKTNWITEDFSEAEVKTVVELAKISATIERRRLEMGMTQKQFADYMGVTQSMVSKWESREYNFTIKSLNDICQKLNLELSVGLEKKGAPIEYKGAGAGYVPFCCKKVRETKPVRQTAPVAC